MNRPLPANKDKTNSPREIKLEGAVTSPWDRKGFDVPP